MNYYWVWFRTSKYESLEIAKFDSQEGVTLFLNSYAGNSEFEFTVVYGSEIKFKAVTVITKYERDDTGENQGEKKA